MIGTGGARRASTFGALIGMLSDRRVRPIAAAFGSGRESACAGR